MWLKHARMNVVVNLSLLLLFDGGGGCVNCECVECIKVLWYYHPESVQ